MSGTKQQARKYRWRDPALTKRQLVAIACAWLAAVLLSGCVSLAQSDARNRLVRVELLALLQTLNAELLSHDSATLTLEHWCADHRLAEPARIVARRERGAEKTLPDDLRAKLVPAADEPVRYRRVQLVCGVHVLSEADNWYLPRRLTSDMNRILDTTDEPFGKVVKPLGFQRRTLSAELLWSPLPAGWEMTPRAAGPKTNESLLVPHAVLRHRAILYGAAQEPFSALVETYTNEVIALGIEGVAIED